MINLRIEEKVRGIPYVVEVFSPDEQVFSVTENGSNTTKYDSREEFLKDFSALKEWLWGVVE